MHNYFTSGKYVGQLVDDITDRDPAYVMWAFETEECADVLEHQYDHAVLLDQTRNRTSNDEWELEDFSDILSPTVDELAYDE